MSKDLEAIRKEAASWIAKMLQERMWEGSYSVAQEVADEMGRKYGLTDDESSESVGAAMQDVCDVLSALEQDEPDLYCVGYETNGTKYFLTDHGTFSAVESQRGQFELADATKKAEESRQHGHAKAEVLS